jgi:5-methyltetrahydrofolate--homocysteine methyltransferase
MIKSTTSIYELVKKRAVLLDGGLGTELIARGFPQGATPESWNLENPDIIKEIHQSYYEAGADVVSTNSFGGSLLKLKMHGLGDQCYSLNKAAAELACSVRPEGKFVYGSIGPSGQFLQPHGTLTEEEMITAFSSQAKGLSDGGIDFFIIETMYDLQEGLMALKACRQNSDKPVFLTLTFNKTPRGFFTMMGNSLVQFCETAESHDIRAIGANCTLDSRDMALLVKELRNHTSLPIIAQANAGQPEIMENNTVSYAQDLEDYVLHVQEILNHGARFIGGCCGTNPDYIRRMASLIT